MDTGSQGCQAFALWLGILPARDRPRAAALLHQAVVDAGMRLTTGNLCTRYLMDMLSDYGYADDVLTLLERQEYPSWGYMLQNAATTVWERFELKENGGMNSHCHPMYGAVDYWLYNRLAGIQPAAPGWERVRIAPVFPVGLLYAEASVSTCRGDVYVRWHKKYGKTSVAVSLPFGTTGELCLPDGARPLASGFQIVTF